MKCPHCNERNPHHLATQRRFECRKKHPLRQFSVKVKTIFEDSPIPLKSWLLAVWQITNCKNGISSYELARAIGVTQKSAWFMNHRIRLAMQGDDGGTLGMGGAEVEIDETYIGGKARNMHPRKEAGAWCPERPEASPGGRDAKQVEDGATVYTEALISTCRRRRSYRGGRLSLYYGDLRDRDNRGGQPKPPC